MNKSTLAATAVAAALGLSLASGTAVADKKFEKCYGVAKAGQNDCATKTASCAGTSTKDSDPYAWMLVPTGMCEKLVGGKLTGPKA